MAQATNKENDAPGRPRLSRGSWAILVMGLLCTVLVEVVLCSYLDKVAREEATYRAQMRLFTLDQQLESCINATNAMALVVQEADGSVSNFGTLAATVMTDHGPISSVQLAPGGVVTDIYPETGNEAGKIDLFADPDRAADAIRARDSHETMVAGPFELKQGGTGIAVRNPVYLRDDDGNQEFWGFTIVIVMADKLVRESNFSYLDTLDYMYRLTADTDDDSIEVAHSQAGYDLDDPVSVSFESCGKTWVLDLQPERGWVPWVPPVAAGILLVAMALLLARQHELMVQTRDQNVRLHMLSGRDALTGLYNRRGFDEAAQALLEGSDQVTFVALDVNSFKLFNDLYGHAVGDALLEQLAHDLVRLAGPGALVARGGGDEFQVVMPGTDGPGLDALVDYASTQQDFTYDGQPHAFGVSLGYARYPQQAARLPELSRRADRALYHCKATGERHCLYQEAFELERREALAFNARDIAQGMPIGLLAYGVGDGRLLFANPALLRLVGCTDLQDLQDLAQGSFANLMSPDDADPSSSCAQAAGQQLRPGLAAGTVPVMLHLAARDGSRHLCLGFAQLEDNDHYGAVCFLSLVDRASLS